MTSEKKQNSKSKEKINLNYKTIKSIVLTNKYKLKTII